MIGQYATAVQLADEGKLQEAIGCLSKLLADDLSLDNALRAHSLELLGRCEMGLLRNVQATVCFDEAEQCYELSGLRAEASYCRLMRVRKLLDQRLLREARVLLAPALREALAKGWSDVLSLGLEYLGLLCFHTKELRKAAGLLEESLERGDSRKLSWEPLVLRLSLANCYAALGESENSAGLLDQITGDPRYQQIPRLAAYILMNQGFDAYVRGNIPAARQYFEQVVELSPLELRSPMGFTWLGGMARYNLGLLAIQEEDYLAARDALHEIVQLASNNGYYQLLSGSLTSLCIIDLMLDQPAAALGHALQCEEYVNQFGDIETRLADYFLALVYLANGQLDNAQLLWLYKPVLEDNSETRLHFSWMQRVLEHLLASGPGSVYSLDERATELARRWLKEVQ